MSRTALVLGSFLALALGPLPAAGVRAADVPTTTTIRGQLRLLFKTWDLNDDGYLDREELAKAFRGARAKPYESPPHGTTEDNKDQGKGESKSPGSKGDKADKADKGDKPDYAKYPDYVFLTEVDENGDGKISRKEFETWARGYATDLRNHLREEDRLKTEAGTQKNAAARKTENQVKSYAKHILEEIKRSQR
jgi:EF-hand domain pair